MGESSAIRARYAASNAQQSKKEYVTPEMTVSGTKRYVKPEMTSKRNGLAHQDTEKGHSAGLTRALNQAEELTRNKKNEELYLFDENGKQIKHINGKGAKVSINGIDMLTIKAASQKSKTVMTHNHPRGIGKDKFGNIGHSFSPQDLATAISAGVSEMRAATPTFTYSMRPGKNGWGDQRKFMRELKRISNEVRSEAINSDLKRHRTIIEKKRTRYHEYLSDRTDVWAVNEINKRLAKSMGWDYTRRQVHKTKGWSK